MADLAPLREIVFYILNNSDMLLTLTVQHIELSFVAVLIAFLIGVPSGILFTKFKTLSVIGLNTVSVLYTIPTLALFGLMIPIIGMGKRSALIALIIYSLIPIVQNAYTGIKNIDENVIEAAIGMGMGPFKMLIAIQLPLATPIILAGLRTAIVNSIGIATIASYIGAGGFGVLVFRGLSSVSPVLIVVGSVPVLLLAVVSDRLLRVVEDRLSVEATLKRQMAQSG